MLPKGIQELAQRSIQSRIHGISCPSEQPTSVDLEELEAVGQFSWASVFGTPSKENHDINSDGPSLFKSPDYNATLTKTGSSRPPCPAPSEERPAKAQKPNEIPAKPMSKAAQKKLKQERLQAQQNLAKYLIDGKEDWGPYYKFGYNKKGGESRPKS